MEMYSLTFDFGSGSVKTALIDSNHKIVSSTNQTYTTCYPKTGWAVQDPEIIWMSMCTTAQSVIHSAGVLLSQVKGIAISHTGSSIIFVDKCGKPLTDCVMWMDGRAVQQAEYLNNALGGNLYTGKNVISKLRWFIENEPEVIRNAYKMVDLQGYLFYRLTGNFAFEFTSARTTRLFDVFCGKWDDSKFSLCGLPKRLIPERVVRSDDLVGRLLPSAAQALGLHAGTPVFGGCVDHATAVLGSACINPGDAHIYIGTSAWLGVTASGYVDAPTIRPSPVPGQWYHYQESDSGGICLEYLWKMFYQKDQSENADLGTLITEESSDISSYKNVLFLPFLTGASAPINDVLVRGSLLNLTASTNRGQIARSVLDGIAFNLKWLKELYSRQYGWNIRCIRGIGGGMLTPGCVQTIANVLGDRIVTMRDPRFAGNIGLSVCVEVGLREHSEGYAILGKSDIYDREYIPQEEFKERYEFLYPVYKEAFSSLSGIYHKLNN